MPARLRSFAKALFGRRRIESEMAEELEFHISTRAEDIMRSGVSPAEARRRALVEFGAVERHKEDAREARGLRFVNELRGDLRYGWRQLRRTPSFSLLAIGVLAIGIGANTAIFSAIDAVMLRFLPVQASEQLRRIEWVAREGEFVDSYNGSMRPNALKQLVAWSVSYPVYRHIRDNSTSFSGLMTFSGFTQLNLTIRGHATLVSGELVSGNYFSTLGTQAIVGRTLIPEDDRENPLTVAAVISHPYWQRNFGSDPAIVGQQIAVNGKPAVIVGVLPKGFCGVNPAWCPDVMLPLAVHEILGQGEGVLQEPDHWYFEVIGRLKPGISDEKARTETELLMRQAILEYRPKEAGDLPRVNLSPGGQGLDELRSEYRKPLRLLMCAVGAVLAIACANLAGLLLVRSAARQREIGIRLAMGAGRWRIMRQLLTEGLLLAFLGGAAGTLLAQYGGNAVVRMLAEKNQPPGVAVAANLKIFGFSLALCLLTGVALGLAPAWRATRAEVLTLVKSSGAGADRAPLRAGKVLIAVQAALSLVLISGSALFVGTLLNLQSEAIGFKPYNILLFQLDPTLNGYKEGRLLDFHEQVLRSVSELPGVTSASISRWGLLAGSRTTDSIRVPGEKPISTDTHFVAPRFFETMGIPLIAGRDVTWNDRESSKPVALVNEALARKYFHGLSPVGRILELEEKKVEIIGVTGNTKFGSLRDDMRPSVFVPFRQNPQHSMTYALRSMSNPKELTLAVRSAIEAIDRNVPMYEVKTQTEQIGELIRRERLLAGLVSGFSLIAVVLAGLGIYGTLAYFVARRTPEIGVHMALGAPRRTVIALVMRETAMPVLIGLACGMVGALASGSIIDTFLFGLKPQNPWALATGAGVLLACSLCASLAPAYRAAGIAPMQALRHE